MANGSGSRATSSPTTSASRATPATARAGATPRSACRGPSWSGAWRSSTPRGSAGSRRCTVRRRRPRCPRRTPCCWCPTPRRSTRRRSWSSSPTPRRSARTSRVWSKTDLHPEWRRIVELDRGHLAAAGIKADIFAVSSTLRWHAVLHGDADINAESGFPELVAYLRKRVLGQADRLARRGVVHDVLAVTEQIGGNLVAERTAQQDPAAVAALTRELTEAQAHATALKERFARWQVTLNDGIADLNADIDYDLRDRMKEISRLAEDELMAGGDPTKVC